ncbi:hypothetical protein WJX73_010549 [Symbiochloris irregularis]|uniref:Cell division control protein 73 C-terminal domain-containing protein n=1 Tax=Symbiochloris irregularis TaxID=706552 RepID=A0AAW1NVZ5_9CHLO
MRLPRAQGAVPVAFLDRKALEEYFGGKTDTDPAIQTELLLPQAAADLASEPAAKRVRFDEGHAAGTQGALLARLLACERSLQDRNSQMTVRDKNFKRVLEYVASAQREAQRNQSNAQAAARSSGHASSSQPSSRSSSHHGRHGDDRHGSHRKSAASVAAKKPPIIIVPSAATAKINIFNAKAILEDGTYITPEQGRDAGAKRSQKVPFFRKFGRQDPVMYELTDQPPDPKSHDWSRVAAIFVTGAAWQFTNYPYKGADKGDTVDTFTHCLGIYLGFKDEQMPDTKYCSSRCSKFLREHAYPSEVCRPARLHRGQAVKYPPPVALPSGHRADSARLYSDPFSQPLLQACRLEDGALRSKSELTFDDLATRFIDDSLATAIGLMNMDLRQEYRQIVLLGCGMDSRPFRMSWPEGTILFELAAAEANAAAKAAMEACKARVPRACLLRRVNADLQSLPAASLERSMERVGFRGDRLSVWGIQGWHYMNMTLDQQRRLLADVSSLAAQNSLVAAEDTDEDFFDNIS